jgi:non-ribosomal peptide synthetase component F
VATRARRAINLSFVSHGRDDLWSFIMPPDAPAVSGLPLLLRSLAMHWCGLNGCFYQRVTVDTTRSDPPRPRARVAARAAQRWEQERAACRKERRIRWRERRERESEEYRLCEQQGLPPGDVGELIVVIGGGRRERPGVGPHERWNPPPPSPRVAEAVVE